MYSPRISLCSILLDFRKYDHSRPLLFDLKNGKQELNNSTVNFVNFF